MVISHKYRFIFVKTGKTAGITIEVFLFQARGDRDVFTPFSAPEFGHEPCNWQGLFNPLPELIVLARRFPSWAHHVLATFRDLRHRHRFTMHLPAWRIRCRVPQRVWRNYYKFCVQRDPFEKVISGWWYYQRKQGAQVGRDEYLDYCRRRIELRLPGVGSCPYNYPNYTDPHTGRILVDRILRFERLETDLSDVLEELGVPLRPPLRIYAKGHTRMDRRPAREILNDRQQATVSELFRDEILMHGYGDTDCEPAGGS